MKRKLSVLLAALLVFAVAGPAAAFFERGNLIQVIYTDQGKENLTDLLNTQTFAWDTPGAYTLTAPGTFATSQFPGKGWGDLRAEFFGYLTGSGKGEAWFATTEKTTPAIRSSSLSGFLSGAGGVQNAAAALATDETVIWDYAGNVKAYDYVMNDTSNVPGGYFAGYNQLATLGTISLAALADPATDYLSMYLYRFNLSAPLASPLGTPYMGELRLFADGHTEMHVVPVPAAVWLLASGVIGLIGIRRRMSN